MPVPAANALMVAGALLIGGVLVSRVAAQLRLPRLTGHMLVGIALGAIGLVSNETRLTLLELERIVACAIAFFVGSLIAWRDVRVSARTVRLLVPCALLTVIAICGGALLALSWAAPHPFGVRGAVVGAAMAMTLASVSPTIVASVAGELGARGPFTRTLLSAVVIADLALLFGLLLLSLAGAPNAALGLLRTLAGAGVVGGVLGISLGSAPRASGATRAFVAVLVALVCGHVLGPSRVAPLVIAALAGVVSASVTTVDREQTTNAALAALPVAAAVLFGLEGLLLDLGVFRTLLVPAALLVVARSVGIWLGTRVGSTLADATGSVRRWSFAGFLPQAGFTLAMVSLLPDLFPALGEALRALAIGVVAINELVMPPVLRHALSAAGEAAPRAAPEPGC